MSRTTEIAALDDFRADFERGANQRGNQKSDPPVVVCAQLEQRRDNRSRCLLHCLHRLHSIAATGLLDSRVILATSRPLRNPSTFDAIDRRFNCRGAT